MDTDTIFLFPPFRLDVRNEQLWRGTQLLALRPKTFAVLRVLVVQAGQLVTQDALLDAVWGPTAVNEAVIRSSIRELRTFLGDTAQHPQFIQTMHRRGYRFIAPVTVADPPHSVHTPAPEGPLRAPLAALPAPEEATKAPTQRSLGEEYKLVTVLCCAVTDAPALAVQRGPEAMHRLMQAFFAVVQAVMQRYDGTIIHVTGEGCTTLFGAPVGQEDHARRAVLAALDLVQDLRAHPLDQAHAPGIGLHTGLVVVGGATSAPPQFYIAVGDAIHQAGRFQRLAPPGTILMSAATQRLVQTEVRSAVFDTTAHDGQSVSGPVYTVQDLTQRRAGVVGQGTRYRSRFAGRTRELAVLHERLAHVVQGDGQVVSIVGEPGIGKSRLLMEFHRSLAGQSVTYREGHCLPYSTTTPYLPVRDLFCQGCGITEADGPEVITAKVRQSLADAHLTPEDNTPFLLQLLDVPVDDTWQERFSPQQRKGLTFALLRHLVMADSRHQPLVLVVENLHWIDATSEEWLTALVEHLAGVAILLLVTHRPGYQPPWLAQAVVTQVALPRLLPEDSRVVVQSVLPTPSLPASLLQTIVATAAGNPFFLEELAWAVRERAPQTALPGIPDTIQAVLAARMDRLPPSEKRLLQTAAVIGTEVAVPLLQALGELSEEAIQQGLRHLQAMEFLYETSLFLEQVYTFKHVLTHEVAYGGLLQERRRGLHARIAQALLERFPETAETRPELLAQHYTAAGVHDQAIRYWEKAGQRANERSAYREAISHLTTALDLLVTLPESRARSQQELGVQMALGMALKATKGTVAPEVEQTYARARTLCEQVGEPPQLFRVLWGLWSVHRLRGEAQTARTHGEDLLRLARRLHDPDLLLEAHHALWTTLFYSGELAAIRPHLAQGLRLYEPQRHRAHAALYSGHDAGVCCRTMAALSLWCSGYPDQALASMQAALDLAQQLAHPWTLANALHWAAVLHHLRREALLAQTCAEAAITIATDQALPEVLGMATFLQGWALAACGHGEDGRAQLRQSLAASRAIGAMAFQPYYLTLLAEVSAQAGQTTEGLEALTEAQVTLATSMMHWWEAELYRLRGVLLWQHAVAQSEEAEACLHQALTIARRQQAKSLEMRAAISLSRLWQAQGKRTAARQVLVDVYGWFTEGFDTADLREAKSLLDELS
jgi:predicted ATPase/class 3 adenylate cyclase